MIYQQNLFPKYIQRNEVEGFIREEASSVLSGRQSRAVLLYGPGGAGKTFLLRHLAESYPQNGITWLKPIDVDDSEYWLLANLERKIAEELNGETGNFQEYIEYLSKLPQYESPRIGHETVVNHLRNGNEVFHRNFERFVNSTGKVPVITLDTVETIRGTDFMLELSQWMKRLPRTLLILAGRSVPEKDDALARELKAPFQPLFFRRLNISKFTWDETLDYFNKSGIADAISLEEKEKLALLTRGKPLWLALTVYYLYSEGMVQEAKNYSISQLETLLPFHGEVTKEGRKLQQSFYNRLLIPYRETDFWHESIKRLAVLRRRVNQNLWEKLMDDRALPDNLKSWEEAWKQLLGIPWIRPRVNRKYVTLHDALAEELTRQVIPLQDKNTEWRRGLWNQATTLYAELIQEQEQKVQAQTELLDQGYRSDNLHEIQRDLVGRSAQLEVDKRELHQLTVTYCYYQLLTDYESASHKLIELFLRVTKEHDFRLGQLLWIELQRFLPSEIPIDQLEAITRPVIRQFREWFSGRRDIKFDLLSNASEYLSRAGYPTKADELLTSLLKEYSGDRERKYRLLILRGDARIRIPDMSLSAKRDFNQALRLTQSPDAPKTLHKSKGEAYMELGFFYRHMGHLDQADEAYRNASDNTPLSKQAERASIQSNWAYVEGLRGYYDEALDLIGSALSVRRRRDLSRGIGMALSVKGEIHRYRQDFFDAWDSYKEAEGIFEKLGDWPWLGQIFQQKAICLYQAVKFHKSVSNEEYKNTDEMLQDAEFLALQSLDVCHDLNRRAYPSALNRAGRIFANDFSRSLKYLEEGVIAAKEMGDGWFWFANLIELAELKYRVWVKSNDDEYVSAIRTMANEIKDVSKRYDFTDLKGRWELIQGHIEVKDAMASISSDQKSIHLSRALEHYKRGFPLIAQGPVGSHGVVALKKEFDTFKELLWELPINIRADWCEKLRLAWGEKNKRYVKDTRRCDSLHARITEIYDELLEKTDIKETTGQ